MILKEFTLIIFQYLHFINFVFFLYPLIKRIFYKKQDVIKNKGWLIMKGKIFFAGICFLIFSTLISGCFTPDIPKELFQLSIKSFDVEPSIIKKGETANLSWYIISAKNASINHGIGNVSLSGERIIIPLTTTTYTLTAYNATASVSASVQIIVKDSNLIILNDELYQNASKDPFTINNVILENDILKINITYTGGCEEHDFMLIGTTSFMESNPVQINILLSHNANNDPCDALINEELNYYLTPLKNAWQEAYQKNSGTIIIWIEGFTESIYYEF